MGDTKAAENFFTAREPDGILHIYIQRKPMKLPKTGRNGWRHEHWDFSAPMKEPVLNRAYFHRKPAKYDLTWRFDNTQFRLSAVKKNVIQR